MLNDMKMKILKKSIMGLALMSMAVSCGEGESFRNVDLQEGIQLVYKTSYNWALLPFCTYDKDERFYEYVVTLRNGSVVRQPVELFSTDDADAKIVIAAADAKDFRIADYFFSKLRADGSYKYKGCLAVYLKCKVTTLLEEGSTEAKDQILNFLNNYEEVDPNDANIINAVCDDVLSRAIRKGDRALAERIIRCYRQDAAVKLDKKGNNVYKPGSYDYEYVFSWKSKDTAIKTLEEAIKNGDL